MVARYPEIVKKIGAATTLEVRATRIPYSFAPRIAVCHYHFTVEQEVGSATHACFGFNGTGGIWRIAAINEAGGWKDQTTVEDMDLAVRASLKGWKFVYLGDLQVKSELPSTFKAFRYHQMVLRSCQFI
ncbi:hypothetical protein POM88_020105 [Heracleum sosnowskyi]|uniref:Glycosyltransferase 2-like domain-containing protein n=1 Tax=Heracleum sosnowskyi TaxID=360622 RepID=A0AAD8IBA9_9APIA|nr:hypothetical protein POM88_020105 [Heracleum sosnowskyi]